MFLFIVPIISIASTISILSITILSLAGEAVLILRRGFLHRVRFTVLITLGAYSLRSILARCVTPAVWKYVP